MKTAKKLFLAASIIIEFSLSIFFLIAMIAGFLTDETSVPIITYHKMSIVLFIFSLDRILSCIKITKNPTLKEVEDLAGSLYTEYCEAVGGRAFNGDPLPSWEQFIEDPSKSTQSNAWIRVAEKTIKLKEAQS